MKDYADLVNVFQGCDEVELPKRSGFAANWDMIKGMVGNVTPAAALPFGRITAGCCSGGYPSGYGRNTANSHKANLHKLWTNNKFRGMSHLHADGTGSIGTYMNYAVISPYYGKIETSQDPRDFDNEVAYPGYYCCRDLQSYAKCEATVTERVALHRINFVDDAGNISIDFSNDGLLQYMEGYAPEQNPPAGKAELEIVSATEVAVTAVLHGLPVHFYVKIQGAAEPIKLWVNWKETDEKAVSLPEKNKFGIVAHGCCHAEITVGISPRSMEIAKADVLNNKYSFDEAVAHAHKLWNDVLSRIDVQFDDPAQYEVFYSNLYHTLIKPADWSGESFLYNDEEHFALEFSTLWDQYKTQMPLLFSVYKDMSKVIIDTLLAIARTHKIMVHALKFDDGLLNGYKTSQAHMLAEHVIVDAWLHGVDFDVKEAVHLIAQDVFENEDYRNFVKGIMETSAPAFSIDMTDACAASAKMARTVGENDIAERLDKLAANWSKVYDKETGLLTDGPFFYEGTRWNYSFRLMHDMENRVALAGGEEKFAALADKFFGYDTVDRDGSFEGFNNETDMETPYVYHYCHRHDRIAQVVQAGYPFFHEGRGGLPGNNDSGGLTSCYIWNVLGIFPVSGQNLMIVGSPLMRKAHMQLANGKTIEMERVGEGIYVRKAMFNGKEMENRQMTVTEFMDGGKIVYEMTDNPAEGR